MFIYCSLNAHFLLKGMAVFEQFLSMLLLISDFAENYPLTVSNNLFLLYSISKVVAPHFILLIKVSEMLIEYSDLEVNSQILV